ncbi:MAG: hypothetical protein WDA16_08040 [Candidatus Thermoplasmatota archaeon]
MPRPARRSGGSRLAIGTVPIALSTISLRLSRKEQFDRVQYRLSMERGRRVTQWETVDHLLDAEEQLNA